MKEAEYLHILYMLTKGEDIYIGTTALANYMNVSPATVVDALNSLSKKGYIIYVKRLGSRLTDRGKKTVTKLIWKHRVLETFIYDSIGGDVSQICEGIKGVELLISDEIINDIYEKLGKPCKCPHGREIPDASSIGVE